MTKFRSDMKTLYFYLAHWDFVRYHGTSVPLYLAKSQWERDYRTRFGPLRHDNWWIGWHQWYKEVTIVPHIKNQTAAVDNYWIRYLNIPGGFLKYENHLGPFHDEIIGFSANTYLLSVISWNYDKLCISHGNCFLSVWGHLQAKLLLIARTV